MILVTGANGNLGKEVIDFLLRGINPNEIVALVRNETKGTELKAKGINIRIGDYDNYSSLIQAFRGIDKLLLISGTDMLNRTEQHKNVIHAAKEAKVKHFFYTNFERNTETVSLGVLAQSHIETEQCIKESGINYTILRNNLYMEFILKILGAKVLETGIFYPAGEGKISFATRSNMAEAIANILTNEGHQNKEYHISNSEQISFKEIAQIISEITGQNIAYVNPEKDVYINTLTKLGVPKESILPAISIADAIKQNELLAKTSDLEKFLNRKPVSVREFLSTIFPS